MALIIHWQTAEDDKMKVIDVNAAFAILRLYLSGTVFQQTEWLPLSEQHAIASESLLQRQIKQYLEQSDTAGLSIDLRKQGTEFSNRVWLELNKIPFGETLTYAQLAQRVGSGARAVANACRNNPFPGLIPCHRVVSTNGIGGFMGQNQGRHVELKRRILQYEAAKKGRKDYRFD